jgi:hypothetical protein
MVPENTILSLAVLVVFGFYTYGKLALQGFSPELVANAVVLLFVGVSLTPIRFDGAFAEFLHTLHLATDGLPAPLVIGIFLGLFHACHDGSNGQDRQNVSPLAFTQLQKPTDDMSFAQAMGQLEEIPPAATEGAEFAMSAPFYVNDSVPPGIVVPPNPFHPHDSGKPGNWSVAVDRMSNKSTMTGPETVNAGAQTLPMGQGDQGGSTANKSQQTEDGDKWMRKKDPPHRPTPFWCLPPSVGCLSADSSDTSAPLNQRNAGPFSQPFPGTQSFPCSPHPYYGLVPGWPAAAGGGSNVNMRYQGYYVHPPSPPPVAPRFRDYPSSIDGNAWAPSPTASVEGIPSSYNALPQCRSPFKGSYDGHHQPRSPYGEEEFFPVPPSPQQFHRQQPSVTGSHSSLQNPNQLASPVESLPRNRLEVFRDVTMRRRQPGNLPDETIHITSMQSKPAYGNQGKRAGLAVGAAFHPAPTAFYKESEEEEENLSQVPDDMESLLDNLPLPPLRSPMIDNTAAN